MMFWQASSTAITMSPAHSGAQPCASASRRTASRTARSSPARAAKRWRSTTPAGGSPPGLMRGPALRSPPARCAAAPRPCSCSGTCLVAHTEERRVVPEAQRLERGGDGVDALAQGLPGDALEQTLHALRPERPAVARAGLGEAVREDVERAAAEPDLELRELRVAEHAERRRLGG